jgi:hypothetical protein
MRQRLTVSILLAGALVLAGACNADREPTAPTVPAPEFSNNHGGGQADLDKQIEKLIVQLFPRPGLVVVALVRFESIEFLIKKDKTGPAQHQAMALADFALRRYRHHDLIGNQSPATQLRLQLLVDLLFQYVGLGPAPIPPGALGPDGAVEIVDENGGTVETGNQKAAAQFPSNAVPQAVLVTISPNMGPGNPLPTELRQVPPFYDFKTFPEVPQFGQPVIVGLCVDDDAVNQMEIDPQDLRLAHPLHSDPSVIEVLPKVTLPFTLDCAPFGARKGSPINLATVGRTVAKDLFWLMMGAPRDLSATGSRRMLMPGGLGGRTSSFSPFGAVEFTGTLMPYGDAGYRYRQTDSEDDGGGFESPSFDDSGFLLGQAAFGSGSEPEGTVCPLDNTVQTSWALNTDLLLRKRFQGGVTNVHVNIAIDNDVEVFVNGHALTDGFVTHEGCAERGSVTVSVPNGFLNADGNVLAVRARDRGVISYVDIQVTGQLQE